MLGQRGEPSKGRLPWHHRAVSYHLGKSKQTPGGFKVLDASGQALVYVYARETREQAVLLTEE
jgi:hypothetical protein